VPSYEFHSKAYDQYKKLNINARFSIRNSKWIALDQSGQNTEISKKTLSCGKQGKLVMPFDLKIDEHINNSIKRDFYLSNKIQDDAPPITITFEKIDIDPLLAHWDLRGKFEVEGKIKQFDIQYLYGTYEQVNETVCQKAADELNYAIVILSSQLAIFLQELKL
jgi:hypothetical protein